MTVITVWLIALGFASLFIFLGLLNVWHLRREESLCLIVLLNTTKTIGMITTEGFATRCGMKAKSARALLERLFRDGLVYGCTDEELWWYWKITDAGRLRLNILHPELELDMTP